MSLLKNFQQPENILILGKRPSTDSTDSEREVHVRFADVPFEKLYKSSHSRARSPCGFKVETPEVRSRMLDEVEMRRAGYHTTSHFSSHRWEF